MDDAGSAVRPGIRIPHTDSEIAIISQLSRYAKQARDLVKLSVVLDPGQLTIPASLLDDWLDKTVAVDLGLERSGAQNKRFKTSFSYTIPDDISPRIRVLLELTEEGIEQLIETLYS